MIMASSSVSKNIGSRVDIDQKREKANTLLAEAVERMQLLRNEVEKKHFEELESKSYTDNAQMFYEKSTNLKDNSVLQLITTDRIRAYFLLKEEPSDGAGLQWMYLERSHDNTFGKCIIVVQMRDGDTIIRSMEK